MRQSGQHVLIVGAGSVGRRHAKNLAALGCRISGCDPRPDRGQQLRAELPATQAVYGSLPAALAEGRFDGVVIASPPHVHVEQTLACLSRRLPVLLEKPIAPDWESAARLERAARQQAVPVLLGYTYRWWPPILALRERLAQGVIGPRRHARFMMSAHLADWHPWERYQDFFMAHQEQGGGALLDESHFLDLMIWFFGMPEALLGRVERLSHLDITTDDNVDLLAVYPDGFRVSVHLDLFGRPHEKSITVVGEQGTLQCLFDPPAVRWGQGAAGPWETTPFAVERNDMFRDEAQAFLRLIAQGPSAAVPCTLAEGVQVLQCVEAARRSTQEHRTVMVADACSQAGAF